MLFESFLAIPAENEVKSLSTKENDEKSLRKGILQPTDSKEEKPSVGTAESFPTSFNATSWPTYPSRSYEKALKSVKKSFKNHYFRIVR